MQISRWEYGDYLKMSEMKRLGKMFVVVNIHPPCYDADSEENEGGTI